MGDSARRLPGSAPSGSKTTRTLALRALATQRSGALVLREAPDGWGAWPHLLCDCKFGFTTCCRRTTTTWASGSMRPVSELMTFSLDHLPEENRPGGVSWHPCSAISVNRAFGARFSAKRFNRRGAMDAELPTRSLFSASIAPLRFFWPWVLVAAPPRCALALVQLSFLQSKLE